MPADGRAGNNDAVFTQGGITRPGKEGDAAVCCHHTSMHLEGIVLREGARHRTNTARSHFYVTSIKQENGGRPGPGEGEEGRRRAKVPKYQGQDGDAPGPVVTAVNNAVLRTWSGSYVVSPQKAGKHVRQSRGY